MDISQLTEILGKHWKLNLLSSKQVIYSDETGGVVQEQKLSNPNLDDYERYGKGISGVAQRSRTYKDQPVTFGIEYQECLTRFHALITDQNPDTIERETASSVVQGFGGEIGLNEKIDIIENQMDRENTNYVKSMVFLNCRNNSLETTIPNLGSASFAYSAIADRGFLLDHPVDFEGWQHEIEVAAQGTPDDTALIASGCGYLRRDAGTFIPRKVLYSGGSTIAVTVVAADSKYVSVVLYETSSNGYSDLALLMVDGAEATPPVRPSDSDIETEVDIASSMAASRWVRVCDILVDETVSPIVNTADISLEGMHIFTYLNSSIILSDETAADAWFLSAWDKHLIFLKQSGAHKRVSSGIASVTDTALTMSSKTTSMIEVCYPVQRPAAIWNPLS